jgi:hypothetical protein
MLMPMRKIKPTLVLGLNVAFEEISKLKLWKVEGKKKDTEDFP